MRSVWKNLVASLVVASLFGQVTARPAFAGDTAADAASPSNHAGVYQDVATSGAVAVAGTVATAPVSIPAGSGDSFLDLVLTPVMEMVRNPFSENAIAIGAVWFTAARFARFSSSLTKLPEAWRDRRKAKEELKKLAAEYELHRAEYLDYPKQIESLAKVNDGLEDELKVAESNRSFARAEILRRKIETNQSVIRAMSAKVPVIMATESIRNIRLSAVAVDESARELIDLQKKSQGRISPDAHTAALRSLHTHRPDYLGEWLDTAAGKTFSAHNSEWFATYRARVAELTKHVEATTQIYNSLVESYNAVVPIAERAPRLAPHASRYGAHSDHFVLTPENPTHEPKEIRQKEVRDLVVGMCDKQLGYLKKNVTTAQTKVKARNAYSNQFYNGGMLLASGAGLYGLSVLYEMKHNVPFTTVRNDSKHNAKIEEAARLDIAGQIDDDKTKSYQLKPFVDSSVRVIRENEEAIVKLIESRLNIRDTNNGKRERLEERVELASENRRLEAARVSASFETAMKKVLKVSSWTKLDDVVENLYTSNIAVRDTVVNRQLTLMFHEAIANLYSKVMDEATLDVIEATLIPKMVAAVTVDLQKVADERKKLKEATLNAEKPKAPGPSAVKSEPAENGPHPAANPNADSMNSKVSMIRTPGPDISSVGIPTMANP